MVPLKVPPPDGRAAEGHAVTKQLTIRQEQLTAEEIGHGKRSGGRTTIRADAIRNLTVVLRSMTDGEVQLLPVVKLLFGE